MAQGRKKADLVIEIRSLVGGEGFEPPTLCL